MAMMRKWARKVRDRLLGKRFALRRWRRQVYIAGSARLDPGFDIQFLVAPENRPYVRIGERALLNMRVVFESVRGTVTIGDRVYFGGGTIFCREQVTIGNDVTLAWGVSLYDHNSHALDWRHRAAMVDHFYRTQGTPDCYAGIDWSGVNAAPIVIEDKVWIGFDAVILKGVRIGEGAVVGARAVVTKDVEPYTVVAGNPARPVKRIEPA